MFTKRQNFRLVQIDTDILRSLTSSITLICNRKFKPVKIADYMLNSIQMIKFVHRGIEINVGKGEKLVTLTIFFFLNVFKKSSISIVSNQSCSSNIFQCV